MTPRRLYLGIGTVLFLLTCAVYVDALVGPGRQVVEEAPHWVQLSKLEVLLPFFPALLGLSVLGLALALVQEFIALPARLKSVGAFAFGFGVLGFAFLRYWNAWVASRATLDSGLKVVTWPVFFSGLLLLFSLGSNLLGLLLRWYGSEVSGNGTRRGGSGQRKHELARVLFLSGGMGLAFGIIAYIWYGYWPWTEPLSTGLSSMVIRTLAFPALLGLGVVGIYLGWLQDWAGMRAGMDWMSAGLYLVGSGLVVWAFAMWMNDTRDWGVSSGIWTVWLKVGAGLVTICVLTNLGAVWLHRGNLKRI